MASPETIVFVPAEKAPLLQSYGNPPTLFQHESGLTVKYEAALTPLRGVEGFNLTIPEQGLVTRQTIKALLAILGLTNVNTSNPEWQYENHLRDFFGPYKYESICEWYNQGLKNLMIHHAPTGVWVKSNEIVGLHEVPDLGSQPQQQQTIAPIPALQAIPALLNGGDNQQHRSDQPDGSHMDIAYAEECVDVEMEDVPPEEMAAWVVGLRTEGGDLDMGDPMEGVQMCGDICLLEVDMASEISTQRRLYIIVDTNVFLSNLTLLVQLNVLFRPAADGKEPTAPEVVVIVPWTVVSELDRLKMPRGKKHMTKKGKCMAVDKLAKDAIDCLLRAQNRKDPFFRGETVVEFREAKRLTKDYGMDTNDDKILRSCLFFAKQLLESCVGGVVMLLTNDKNLAFKAQSHGVLARNSDQLKPSREVVDTVMGEAHVMSSTLRQLLGLPVDPTTGDPSAMQRRVDVPSTPPAPPQVGAARGESRPLPQPPMPQQPPAIKPSNGHANHSGGDAMQVDTPNNLGYNREKSDYFSSANVESTTAAPKRQRHQQSNQGPSGQPTVVTPVPSGHQGGHLERGGHTSGRGDGGRGLGGGRGDGSILQSIPSPGQRSQGSSIDSPLRGGRGGRGRMPRIRSRGEPRPQMRRNARNAYQPDPRTASLLGQLESSGDYPTFRHSEILTRVKQTMETGLSGVLQYYLQQEFKTLWTDIVVVPPPWSFRDCVSVAEKHWNSVYSSYCPGPIRACLDEISIGSKMERSGVSSGAALKIIACSRDMLNAFRPPRGDIDRHLGGSEYPPVSAETAGRLLYEAQHQINRIYGEFCSELEGGSGGGYDHGFGGGGYGSYGGHGYGGGRGPGWGGDRGRGRGRGFGRGMGGRGVGYGGGYGGDGMDYQQEGYGGSNGYGAGQAGAGGDGGQGLSLPPTRTDLSWVRMATSAVKGQSRTGREILMFIGRLQAAIEEAANRESKVILETPGKKSALDKVVVALKELFDSVCWVSHELWNDGNGSGQITDQTLDELIKKMQGFVSQVYTDSNKICGKALSMPTDAFKAQLRADLVELFKSGDYMAMQEAWQERYNGFVRNFNIQLA